MVKLKHIPEFDGIRGIAALMVMVFHFFQNKTSTDQVWLNKLLKLTAFGQTGVTLFFVLSGFLITRILLHSKQSDSYFKPFYVRRSLRIFPLYFLFLVIYYFLLPQIQSKSQVPLSQQWSYWVYLQNFAITFGWPSIGPLHFWSLAVEEHFYLFWPILVYFSSVKSIERIIYIIIAVAFVLRMFLFSYNYEVFYFTFTNMDSLALGALLAVQENKREGVLNRKIFLGVFVVTLLAALVIWIFTSGKALLVVQGFKNLLLAMVYYSLLGFIFCLNEGAWICKALRIGVLRYTGRISYGLYVYHPLCFSLLSFFNCGTGSVILDMIVAFGFSYILSSFSYFAFEVHFLKLKKYFEY